MAFRTEKELAYRYDLYVVPTWREPLDQMVEKHVPLPKQGSILEVNCGTGGLALDVAGKIGMRGEVIAADPSAEMLEIARAKATVKKLQNLIFLEKNPADLGLDDEYFCLAIGDATLVRPAAFEPMLAEMVRVCETGATVALKLLAHGSFDEFYSVMWEAAHDCGLGDYSTQIEALTQNLPTVTDVQTMLTRAGLMHPHCFVEREEYIYESPLIEDYFLDGWFSCFPDDATVDQVRRAVVEIIDRERRGSYFDFSVKATLAIGRKE
jgi:ubiquinone/menaquinone biosynthesis C-methylase UbiE